MIYKGTGGVCSRLGTYRAAWCNGRILAAPTWPGGPSHGLVGRELTPPAMSWEGLGHLWWGEGKEGASLECPAVLVPEAHWWATFCRP